jgi:hypothetical protein
MEFTDFSSFEQIIASRAFLFFAFLDHVLVMKDSSNNIDIINGLLAFECAFYTLKYQLFVFFEESIGTNQNFETVFHLD